MSRPNRGSPVMCNGWQKKLKKCRPVVVLVGTWVLTTHLTTRDVSARDEVVPGSRYTSARGAAMGDAAIATADDPASDLFYNPAGIGWLRAPHLEPLNLTLGANMDYVKDLSATNFYQAPSLTSYKPTLQNHSGDFPGVQGSILPNFGTRGFAIGVLAQSSSAAISQNGTIRYRSRYEIIPTAGFGFRLASGILRVGYSIQYINTAVGDLTVPDTTDPLGYNQNLSQGAGISHNVGVALTLPFQFLPALNFVARNVGTLRYSMPALLPLASNSPGAPADEPMTLDASFSVRPRFAGGSFWNLIIEDRDITAQSQISVLGRLAFGAELSFHSSFFLRAGWGSGYPSAGIAFRRPKTEISFTWYSVELGPSYQSNQDQRLMLQYQVLAF